jgi:alcohol dehydrogenase (cytochrome c)
VSTGRTEWKYEQRAALLSLVATGGGLLFGGDVAGRFRAFDQRSGQVLWQTNLGSQVTGFPITYAVRDRQYVAVSVGQAVNTAGYLLMTPEIRPSSNNSLYVFALPEGLRTTQTTPRKEDVPALASATSALTSGRATPATAPVQCRRTSQATSRPVAGTANRLFNPAQSAHGRKVYVEQQCSLCHGESMRGSASAPALADPGFRAAWQDRSLGALFDCMKSTMPPGRSAALSDVEYVDLLAAILEANGFAPGNEQGGLPADPEKLNGVAFGRAP